MNHFPSRMDKLWAPWRIDYIRSEKEEGCIFCEKPKNENEEEALLLYRGKSAFVMMNLYPYNNGHLLIAPFSHVDNSNDMTEAERMEVMSLADSSMAILNKSMLAEGFNYGANIGHSAGAGIAEHIHFHVVPRWQGDTNFMPVVGNTKVQVEGLQETYSRLKPYYDSL